MTNMSKIEAATIRMAKRIMKKRWSAADLCTRFNSLTPPTDGTLTAKVWMGGEPDAEIYEIGVFVGGATDDEGERAWSVSFVAVKTWDHETARWSGSGAKVHWITISPHDWDAPEAALKWLNEAAQ